MVLCCDPATIVGCMLSVRCKLAALLVGDSHRPGGSAATGCLVHDRINLGTAPVDIGAHPSVAASPWRLFPIVRSTVSSIPR
jgi:hypothetical protein